MTTSMGKISVKELKKLLDKVPDDAECYAYEGEVIGICIHHAQTDTDWFICASEGTPLDKGHEGFES